MSRSSTVHGYGRPGMATSTALTFYNTLEIRNHSNATSELANELFKMIQLAGCFEGMEAQVFCQQSPQQCQAGGLVFFPASSEGKQAGPVAWTFLLSMVAKCPKGLHCLPASNRLGATSSSNAICTSSTPVVPYS